MGQEIYEKNKNHRDQYDVFVEVKIPDRTYEVVIYVYYQDQLLYQTKDWFHYD